MFRYAGAGADLPSTGTVTWVDPGSITANDAIGATALIGQQAASHYLEGSNFLFAIPPEATILGIQVTIQRKASHAGSLIDGEVRLIKDGSPVGADKAASVAYDTVYTDALYGGPADLWGTTWTPADINSSGFGVALSVLNTHLSAGRTAAVDFMQVAVTYKTATLTTVSCAPDPVAYGSGTICTATVTQTGGVTKPMGTVNWSTAGSGNFSGDSCTLSVSAGTAACSVTYSLSGVAGGSHLVTAEYAGNTRFLPSNGNMTLAVNKALLTVTAEDQTILVGQPDPPLTYVYTGLIGADTSADIDTQPSCVVDGPHTGPGDYPIVCRGGLDDNYDFTYVDGTLKVNLDSPPTGVGLSSSSLSENHLSGFTVGTLTTGDPDISDTFSYSFCGGDQTAFTIAGDALQTAARFDFETKPSYSICIRSTDSGTLWTEQTFPITVTNLPETFRSAALADGWVLESTETSSAGGSMNAAGSLFVGDNAANKQYRSILSFNTMGLPNDAVITKVTLRVRRQGVVGADPFTTHLNLLVDARKGAFGAGALQLGDFQAFANLNSAAIVGKMPLAGGWYQAVFKPAALTNLNKAGLTQLRLRFSRDDNNDLGADYLKLYSGNAPLASRPILAVEYYVP
jgi:hypothetical protein